MTPTTAAITAYDAKAAQVFDTGLEQRRRRYQEACAAETALHETLGRLHPLLPPAAVELLNALRNERHADRKAMYDELMRAQKPL